MPLTALPAWRALAAHFETIRDAQMRDWFAAEDAHAPTRAQRFTRTGGGLTLDFSKNRITDQSFALLLQLAREAGVEQKRDAMFAGEIVNPTEKRAALHTALRASDAHAPHAALIHQALEKMSAFAERVRGGHWRGYTGKPIRSIVNIGIGGSELGPKMVCEALHPFGTADLDVHFVSNIDGAEIQRALESIDLDTTLAIVVSKTFTTLETMSNARTLRDAFLQRGAPEAALNMHFVGVTANAQAAIQFGIAFEHLFEMWDWVGGRYSLWSAAGLAIMLKIGPTHFSALRAGAQQMDQHFLNAPLGNNLPVIIALLGIWYRNFFGAQSHLIAPYTSALRHLPAYLQQLEMESNGKSVDLDGQPVPYATAPVLWGAPGTNGQHAFFQMLHQGATLVPTDFIAALKPEHSLFDHHVKLLANCFAQSEALMRGQDADPAPHLRCPGNQPSNTLLLEALTPRALGALLALYEHKTFVQAAVWRINPFDQWGVELGKRLSIAIARALNSTQTLEDVHDSSTRMLIECATHWMKEKCRSAFQGLLDE
ncbi:Glucose-6-phosphate isomerase (GPI) (Phosphoglucose isomerase) (PGI) (Phosphohexose isomerase) (PHI) [Candidatus Glomeribacter gigasporarum BEG34]|uniref:Glucose-6-phosphate isomerase n=1 Tax=Candidatus Glomeribacter gigasporarum BEG34 TaxID=1070319 RepID=G2JC57_9BURK|nr:glucose-6-phosphate isomerase [Candidatus Glomeribacter gigasporarum]CCD30365.1 Glucose-6-phosphate isomerase (GPI) (Phosphoglucose isomerase) (PGI) (Phosphohexose isomerase) (PHI) [Candidatus Glomeribacter gigasporarum BEG34]